jgi:hypothetical protein
MEAKNIKFATIYTDLAFSWKQAKPNFVTHADFPNQPGWLWPTAHVAT